MRTDAIRVGDGALDGTESEYGREIVQAVPHYEHQGVRRVVVTVRISVGGIRASAAACLGVDRRERSIHRGLMLCAQFGQFNPVIIP